MSVRPLIEWIAAREALRKKKESGAPPPWTDDPILQKFRFTNVRRCDDRVSRWLLKYVLLPENLQDDLESFISFVAFCRWCNWPPTIQEIMGHGLYPQRRINWGAIVEVLEGKRARREKVWTGAYMITARGCSEGESKAHYIVERVVHQGIKVALPAIDKALQTHMRREVWLALRTIPSYGSFMAGQIIDDLGWTPLLWRSHDVYTWAPQGPGSLRGFNRLLGLPLKTSHPEEEWCGQLQAWRREVIVELGKKYRNLTLMDLQNCLCEYSKYRKAQLGEGRPRSTYEPETAYGV